MRNDPRGECAGRGRFGDGLEPHYLSGSGPTRQVPRTVPLTADPAFRRHVERIHALGPRPLGEMLAELAARPGCASAVVAGLDPAMLHQLGGDRWLTLPLREVLR